jgi:hypothetical protein
MRQRIQRDVRVMQLGDAVAVLRLSALSKPEPQSRIHMRRSPRRYRHSVVTVAAQHIVAAFDSSMASSLRDTRRDQSRNSMQRDANVMHKVSRMRNDAAIDSRCSAPQPM